MTPRKGWMSSGPLEEACPLCDEPLGGGNQRTNPLIQTRRGWAHRSCVAAEKGE
jgi:hypothetical protein